MKVSINVIGHKRDCLSGCNTKSREAVYCEIRVYVDAVRNAARKGRLEPRQPGEVGTSRESTRDSDGSRKIAREKSG